MNEWVKEVEKLRAENARLKDGIKRLIKKLEKENTMTTQEIRQQEIARAGRYVEQKQARREERRMMVVCIAGLICITALVVFL